MKASKHEKKDLGEDERLLRKETSTVVKSLKDDIKQDVATAEEDAMKGKTKPRTFVQKFLFMVMAGLQTFVVYMVMYDIDYGIPALRTTGGPIVFQYAALIALSFVLSFASFLLSCFPPTVEKGKDGTQKNDIALGIDTANATVGTFLVQALSSKTWGAEGDMITILKYLIQYQVLITYVNVGFTVAWSAPHIELPDFVGAIGEFFNHIDDYINAMLQPITDFIGIVLYAICWPFIALWGVFWFIVFYLLSFLDPLKYAFAYLVVYTGKIISFISDGCCFILKTIGDAICSVLYAIGFVFEQVLGGIQYVFVVLLVNPVVWLYETIVNAFISLGTAISDCFTSMMEFLSDNFECIKRLWRSFQNIPVPRWEEKKNVLYSISGYIEKKGHIRTNWTTRFFTLKRGLLKYFLREGNDFPRVGDGLKGELDLRNYEEAYQHEDFPIEVYVKSTPTFNKDYQFRLRTEQEAKNLVFHLNSHIQWCRNPTGIEINEEDIRLVTNITEYV